MSSNTLISSSQDTSFIDLLTDNKQDMIARAAQSSYGRLLDAENAEQEFWPSFQQSSLKPDQAAMIINYFAILGEAYAADHPAEADILKTAPERIFKQSFAESARLTDDPDYSMTYEGQKNMHHIFQSIRNAAHIMTGLNSKQPTTEITDRLLALGDSAGTQGRRYMQMLNASPV